MFIEDYPFLHNLTL